MLRKKLAVATSLILLMIVLAGCNTKEPINVNSTGIWNEYFVYPLSWFITYVADLFNGSYGLSIVITTVMVRLVLLPLMIKQTKSSKAMQEVQPEIKKLKAQYSSKDQKTQKKLQEETMKLFQANKVNPLAGCFPIVIQMPILIAFYHAIIRTDAIKHHDFLWFSLGHADPYHILPVIAAITTFVQQKILLGRTGNANPQMAMMMYIFPIFIGGMAFYFPAALALYWVVGNIFMVVQTHFIYAAPKKTEITDQTGGAKKK